MQRLFFVLLAVLILHSSVFSLNSHAATITLPQTGQTVCYNAGGAVIPCALTGQDADKLKGAAWPVPRFTANMKSDGTTPNGTVTDSLTGLIWLKDANCFGATQTWATALTTATTLLGNNTQCSLNDGSIANDWRLPNRKELLSLLDRQNTNPPLPSGHLFANVQTISPYWTSSTFADGTTSAWRLSLNDGLISGSSKTTTSNHVWPVRGGQFGDSIIDALPATKNFGVVEATTGTASQTFTISNGGAASRLQINAMALSGTNAGLFSLNVGDGTSGTCGSTTPIIAAGGNCTVSVTFTPGTIGAKAANLRISGSDVNTPNLDVALSGTGGYTVTYNGNTNTGGSAPVDSSSPYISGATVTVLGNTGSLTKTGYTFAGWNTASDGSGTSYAPAATFVITSNTTLYATWGYSVTYNGNTNTSGAVPTDATAYLSGATVTVKGNTGVLTKTGFTFAGWNTLANGTGTDYAPAATFAITSNTTLYAKWTATVTYNGNGNTGGAVPVDATVYLSGATVTVLGNTGTLVKTGLTFAGWNTLANGTGTNYAPAATFAITGNTTLYAKWTATVTYDGNTSTGGTVPTDATAYLSGAIVTVKGNTGVLTKTGFTFAGWNTLANGSGATYTAGSGTFAITANTTLYAKWTALPAPPTTIYNTLTFTAGPNGTLSGATSQTIGFGDTSTSVTALPSTGYHFVNWSGSNGFTTTVANPLTLTSVTASYDITANFAPNPAAGTCGSSNGGTFSTAPTTNLCLNSQASTVNGTGPWSWFCVVGFGQPAASCTANVTVAPATTAKVFLGADDTITIGNSGATVYGGSGNNTVIIAAGVTGVIIDQNVGQINLPGPLSSYTFKQVGNIINVYDITGSTLIVSVPVQGNGTKLSFSDGTATVTLTNGVMTIGGIKVSTTTAGTLTPTLTTTTTPPAITTTAKIFLGTDDAITISNSGATVYGGSGNNTVTVTAGVTGITLDQNIGQINLAGSLNSYTFKQIGNTINVYDITGSTLIVTVPVRSSGTKLSFSDGTATALLNVGTMTLGGVTVSSTTAGALVPILTANTPLPPTVTAAKIFLGTDDRFTVQTSGTTVYGGNGNSTVTVAAGVTGVIIDQNVGQINLAGLLNSYTFKQIGNTFAIYDVTAGTVIVTGTVQKGGTKLSFSNGTATVTLINGVMTLGGVTISTTSPSALTPTLAVGVPLPVNYTKAKVFLGTDDRFTINNSGMGVYGGRGINTVTIIAGITGVIIDQNVARINMAGSFNSYTFKQTGNKLNIYDSTGATVLVTVPVQVGGTTIGFADGTASALLSAGVMTLGGATVSTSTAGTLSSTLK